MGYTVVQRVITSNDWAYSYLDRFARKAKLLYNAALFRIRNIFTGYDKDHRTENETEVFAEVQLLQGSYPGKTVRKVITYYQLEKLLRVTGNPDFFSGLPMQTAQAVVKSAVSDFRNWLSALKEYQKHPEKFLGKPKMPKYKRTEVCTFGFSNQDVVLYPQDTGVQVKLPMTRQRLFFSNLSADACLREVKVKPYYGRYLLLLTFQGTHPAPTGRMPHSCAIDFGTDNFAAIVCGDQSSVIYKGGAVLSSCQWFHKQRARLVGILTKGSAYKNACSRQLSSLSYHHANFIKDQCHKISRSIINYCLEHQAGTLVLGVNKLWKQGSRIGNQNNQSFVSMPVTLLRELITYKALNAGIRIIEQEESYTSKADVTAGDYLPTYGVDDGNASFSGKRLKRGLYRCHDGRLVNADCNGAANILRKVFPDIWNQTADFGFLATPEVVGFHQLNP